MWKSNLLLAVKPKCQFQQCLLVHIQREADNLADSFPKAGLDLLCDVCFYNSVALFAEHSLMEDDYVISSQLGIN